MALIGGDYSFDNQTNTLSFFPTNKYNVIDSWRQAGDKIQLTDPSEWEIVKIPGMGGKAEFIQAPNMDKFKQRLALEFENNTDAQRNAIVNYKRENNLSGKDFDTPEEYADMFQKAREKYINDGYEWGLSNKSKTVSPPGKGVDIRNYVSMGGEAQKSTAAMSPRTIKIGRFKKGGGRFDYELNNISSFALPRIKASTNIGGVRSLQTGRPLEGDKIVDTEWNNFDVVPVYNEKFEDSEFVGTIPTEGELKEDRNKGKISYIVVSSGRGYAGVWDEARGTWKKDSTGKIKMEYQPIYSDASISKNVIWNVSDPKDKPVIDANYRAAQEEADRKNKESDNEFDGFKRK
jgi:hypothetical protein